MKSKKIVAFLLTALAAGALARALWSQSICAVVKLEILQKATNGPNPPING